MGFPGRYLFVRRPAEASVLQLSPLVVAPASPLIHSNSGYRHSTRLRLRDPPPLYLFHAVVPPSSSPARVLTRVPGVGMVLAVLIAARSLSSHTSEKGSPLCDEPRLWLALYGSVAPGHQAVHLDCEVLRSWPGRAVCARDTAVTARQHQSWTSTTVQDRRRWRLLC
ncbi:hypothetical protein PG993_006137 [Apiospora rasikravindrae]|uniref:Uncharacterized protein n=1 Tax=Apiospora rasikravindrae TaxID=990691 RepID=A0ABR1TAS4_9PEZI